MAYTGEAQLTAPYVSPDSLEIGNDSIAGIDSVNSHGMQLRFGLQMTKPLPRTPEGNVNTNTGISWIFSGLFLVFVVVCLRYRKNTRYFSLIFNDITEVRERHNAFDDTLRETTFVWLLNLLWCGAAGILLFLLLYGDSGRMTYDSVSAGRLAVCIGMAGAYTLFLALAYVVIGNLFSDGGKASVWVKGYLSSQGLQGLFLFPVAMIGLCFPYLSYAMLLTGCLIFILAKILFIYKGFCIFFTKLASWVLFLYYLCSLEIVPIVLTYVGAGYLCNMA